MVAMVAGDSGSPTPYGGVTSSGGDSIVGPGGIIAAGRADIFRPGPALPVQKCRRWPIFEGEGKLQDGRFFRRYSGSVLLFG